MMTGLIEEFQRWLLEDGKSPRTVDSYCQDVKKFQQYVAENTVEDGRPLWTNLSILLYGHNFYRR